MRINSDWTNAKKDKELQKRSDLDTLEYNKLKIYELLKKKFEIAVFEVPNKNGKYSIVIYSRDKTCDVGIAAGITTKEFKLFKKGW